MRPTPSSTRWCRTQRTTRCSRAADRSCTPRSRARSRQRFPDIKTTEPEVLAHHLTAAGLAEAAIPLWQAAGELALKRMALTEAISHLNQGARTDLHPAPVIGARCQRTGLRTRLGTAWRRSKAGPPRKSGPACIRHLRWRSRSSATTRWRQSSADCRATFCTQGRVAESLPWVQEMLDIAKATGDADLLIAGHMAACACYCSAGESHQGSGARRQGAGPLRRREASPPRGHPQPGSQNVGRIFGSISTWMLGYPDRALRLNNEKDVHARRRGHPFDLGFALSTGAHEFDHRWNAEELRKRAEECERLGRENSLPVCGRCGIRCHMAWHLSGKAKPPKQSPRSRLASRSGKRAAARTSAGPESAPGRSHGADRRPRQCLH